MRVKLYGITTLLIIASLWAHGCGGGSSPVAPALAQGGGNGKVAATVKLTGRVAGRMAALSATSTVNVTITISGVYSEDKKEFAPVSTTFPVSLAQGHASVSLVKVPTGVNHLLVAVADWGGATETVKVIIPSVETDAVTTVTADASSTVVADTAIYYANQHDKALYEVPADTITGIQVTVGQMAANGISWSDMTPASVLAYQGNRNVPASITLTPASATVVVSDPLQFTALVRDANGTALTGATATWSFSAPSVGGISPAGLFTGTAAGSGVVTASYATLTASVPVSVVSVCTNDAQCNDNITLTIDTCLNPRTVNAQCTHAPIACLTGADCNDNNPYTLDTCTGGGAIGAACSNTVIPNIPPTVAASSDVATGTAPLTVNFTGTCADSDGTCISYAWDFGDGTAGSLRNPSHAYISPGTYTATLTATDNRGGTGTATASITVAENQPPAGSISSDFTSGAAPVTVNFTGACTDVDGTCVSYLWDFGDGSPTSSSPNPSHAYTMGADYIVTLTVTDNNGASTQTQVSLKIDPLCGNNVIEIGETCDDGNTISGDGCSSTCQIESKRLFSVRQTPDGGFIAGGNIDGVDNTDGLVEKFDSSLTPQWSKTFVTVDADNVMAVNALSGGGYVAAGDSMVSPANTYRNAWVLKYDNTGTVAWTTTELHDGTFCNGGTYGYIYIKDMLVTGSDDTVIAGDLGACSSGNGIFLWKLDSSGNELSKTRIPSTIMNADAVFGIDATTDGGYIIAGQRYLSWDPLTVQMLILKLDASGNEVWSQTFGNSSDWNIAVKVKQTTDGGYVVAGTSRTVADYSGRFVQVKKLDSAGVQVWSQDITAAGYDVTALQIASDGGYIVAGRSDYSGTWIKKLDASGIIVSSNTSFSPDMSINALEHTTGGGYIIGGINGPLDWLQKLNANLQ